MLQWLCISKCKKHENTFAGYMARETEKRSSKRIYLSDTRTPESQSSRPKPSIPLLLKAGTFQLPIPATRNSKMHLRKRNLHHEYPKCRNQPIFLHCGCKSLHLPGLGIGDPGYPEPISFAACMMFCMMRRSPHG